jgi:hypothetical protein
VIFDSELMCALLSLPTAPPQSVEISMQNTAAEASYRVVLSGVFPHAQNHVTLGIIFPVVNRLTTEPSVEDRAIARNVVESFLHWRLELREDRVERALKGAPHPLMLHQFVRPVAMVIALINEASQRCRTR